MVKYGNALICYLYRLENIVILFLYALHFKISCAPNYFPYYGIYAFRISKCIYS